MFYSCSSPQDSFLNHPSTLRNNPYISWVSYAIPSSQKLGIIRAWQEHVRGKAYHAIQSPESIPNPSSTQCSLHPESYPIIQLHNYPLGLVLVSKNSESWKLRILECGLLDIYPETWKPRHWPYDLGILDFGNLGISLSSALGTIHHHLKSKFPKSQSITWPHNYSTSPNSDPL